MSKQLVIGFTVACLDLLHEGHINFLKSARLHCDVLVVGVMPDHVHLLLDVNPKHGIYDIVNHIKGFTSHELRKEFKELRTKLPTLWTRSKFISTVGAVTLEVVKRYIEEQKGK